MTFEFVSVPQLQFDLETETINDGRYYVTPNGNKYPSVTTILGAGKKDSLQEWINRVGEREAEKIKRMAANRGSRLHALCEDYLTGKLSDTKIRMMMPFDKMLFKQIRPLIDKNINRIHCMEQALYSHKLKIAGRVDLVAEWKKTLSIVDYKSSIREKEESWIENYFLQCTAYALMFEELTNKVIDDIVVVIATEDQMPQVFERKKSAYVPKLYECIYNYGRKEKKFFRCY